MLRNKAVLPGPIAQEVAHSVVKTKEPLFEIAFEQQRQIEQPAQKVVGLEVLKPAGRGPQPRDNANRNLCILWKDAKLAEPLAFGLGQKVEADANCERDGVSALSLVTLVEGRKALLVEPHIGARDGDRQRFPILDEIAQEPVDDLDEERPLAKAGCEVPEAGSLACRLIRRQAARQKAQRLGPLHRVDLLPRGRCRQIAVDPRGDQPDAVATALQERLQVLLAPNVVDDHEDPAIAQRLPKFRRRRVDRLKLRPLAGQQGDEVGKGRDQPLWLLAELSPQDSVEISVLDVGIAGERLGERRLAIAASAAHSAVMPATESPSGSSRRALSASNSFGRATKSSGVAGAIIGTRRGSASRFSLANSAFFCSRIARS
jgi:hypothetical protein